MAINRKQVIENLSKIEVSGNQDGLINAFGVYVNQLPSGLWNNFSERLTRASNDELKGAVEDLLINAAHECGYHTGYGIITSDEWKAVVEPMVQNVEDVLHGAYAVLGAFGWANAEIVELVPGEKMIIRASDYYEADVVSYGNSSKLSAYMLSGVSAAFMDLAYGEAYPNGIYKFTCRQTKGKETGQEYGEFEVIRE